MNVTVGVVAVGRPRFLDDFEAVGADVVGHQELIGRQSEVQRALSEDAVPKAAVEKLPVAKSQRASDLEGAGHSAEVERLAPMKLRGPDLVVKCVEHPKSALAVVGEDELVGPEVAPKKNLSEVRLIALGGRIAELPEDDAVSQSRKKVLSFELAAVEAAFDPTQALV